MGGVFNPQLSVDGNVVKTFPIQPIEALIAIGVAVFIALREKKKNYKTDGLSIPIMLMLFGYSRFFLEFARDNDKLFWNISELALHALVAGIVGTVSYFVIKNIRKKRETAIKPEEKEA